jgi:hypothetical protein
MWVCFAFGTLLLLAILLLCIFWPQNAIRNVNVTHPAAWT